MEFLCIVVLPLVLYGCEIWCLTLKDDEIQGFNSSGDENSHPIRYDRGYIGTVPSMSLLSPFSRQSGSHIRLP